MNNLHIVDSYNVWLIPKMKELIDEECARSCGNVSAEIILNRHYWGMYLEWYLHNIGYYLTLPFPQLNERFRHVDLEQK